MEVIYGTPTRLTCRWCCADRLCDNPDCLVCYWGRQPQPETLLAKRRCLEDERRAKALGVA